MDNQLDKKVVGCLGFKCLVNRSYLFYLEASNKWSTTGCILGHILRDLEEATEGLLLNFADDIKLGGNHLICWR